MMSVLSGEMTKQIRSAPAWSKRSTRNSLTALGRSTPCSSKVLPTGSISFENASGWSREPAPAAGTMPRVTAGRLARRGLARRDQLSGAAVAGVLGQGPLARGGADPRQLRVAQVQRRFGLVCVVGHQDLLAGFEELLYTRE